MYNKELRVCCSGVVFQLHIKTDFLDNCYICLFRNKNLIICDFVPCVVIYKNINVSDRLLFHGFIDDLNYNNISEMYNIMIHDFIKLIFIKVINKCL